MILLLVFTCLLVYSAISGYKDAILYSGKVHHPEFPFNPHKLYQAERISVGGVLVSEVILSALGGFQSAFCDTFILSVCWLACFSFAHNSIYLWGRGHIARCIGIKNPYPKGFRDDSSDSSAETELVLWQRTALFLLGIGGLIAYIIVK